MKASLFALLISMWATGLLGNSPECFYSVDGVPQDAGVILTHTGANVTVELNRLGECPTPVAVAIGGGGKCTTGGGGSGYVSHTVELPPTAYVKMIAFSGGPGQDSYIKVLDNDSFILRGEKGGDGGKWNGGAGWQFNRIFWPEKQPQYRPENRPEVPFEKDISELLK